MSRRIKKIIASYIVRRPEKCQRAAIKRPRAIDAGAVLHDARVARIILLARGEACMKAASSLWLARQASAAAIM